MIEYITLNPAVKSRKKRKAKKKAKLGGPTVGRIAKKKRKPKKAKHRAKRNKHAARVSAFSKASRGVARGNVKKRRKRKASGKKRSKSVAKAKTKKKARRTAKQKAAARKNIKKAQKAARKANKKGGKKRKAKARKARKVAQIKTKPRKRRGKKRAAKKGAKRARKWNRKGMDKGIRHSKFGQGRRSYRPKFRKGKQTKRVKENLVKYGYAKWGKGGRVYLNPLSVDSLVTRLKQMVSINSVKDGAFTLAGMSAAVMLPEVAGRFVPQLRGMQLSANSVQGVVASGVSTAVASLVVGKFLGAQAGESVFKGGSLVVMIRLLGLAAPSILRKLGLDRAIRGGPAVIDVPAVQPSNSSIATAAAIQQSKGMGADFLTPAELVAGESASRMNGFISMDGFIDPVGLENRVDFVPSAEEAF